MKKTLIALSFAFSIPAAYGQVEDGALPVQCGHTSIFFDVARQYGEQITWTGKMNDGSYIIILENPATKSFTAMLTTADGSYSCVVASSVPEAPSL